MLIAIIVIIGLSILILGHEAGHFLVAKLFGMKIEEFGFGFPPRIFSWRPKKTSVVDGTLREAQGDTEYSVNWLPCGGFVKIAGENDPSLSEESKGQAVAAKILSDEERKKLFCFRPWWQKSLVILAGVTVNFMLGWLLISAVLMVGTPKALVIEEVQHGSPGAAVGLLSGDVIKGYDGAGSFIQFVDKHRGEEINLNIMRGGKSMTFNVVPRVETKPGEGAIGVALAEAGEPKEGFFAALGDGFMRSVQISGLITGAFYNLFKNLFLHASLLEGVAGPVGIFAVAEQTGRIGFAYLIELISLISINLAVVNLVPFPALDGGRFLMILFEKIKGRPIPRRAEALINNLGFALLILLMVLITVRDVGNLL